MLITSWRSSSSRRKYENGDLCDLPSGKNFIIITQSVRTKTKIVFTKISGVTCETPTPRFIDHHAINNSPFSFFLRPLTPTLLTVRSHLPSTTVFVVKTSQIFLLVTSCSRCYPPILGEFFKQLTMMMMVKMKKFGIARTRHSYLTIAFAGRCNLNNFTVKEVAGIELDWWRKQLLQFLWQKNQQNVPELKTCKN